MFAAREALIVIRLFPEAPNWEPLFFDSFPDYCFIFQFYGKVCFSAIHFLEIREDTLYDSY